MPTQADMNEDWIKTRPGAWDIWRPGYVGLVTKSSHLRDELGYDDERIKHMLDLPVMLGAPDSLLQDLAEEGHDRAREILDQRAATPDPV